MDWKFDLRLIGFLSVTKTFPAAAGNKRRDVKKLGRPFVEIVRFSIRASIYYVAKDDQSIQLPPKHK